MHYAGITNLYFNKMSETSSEYTNEAATASSNYLSNKALQTNKAVRGETLAGTPDWDSGSGNSVTPLT